MQRIVDNNKIKNRETKFNPIVFFGILGLIMGVGLMLVIYTGAQYFSTSQSLVTKKEQEAPQIAILQNIKLPIFKTPQEIQPAINQTNIVKKINSSKLSEEELLERSAPLLIYTKSRQTPQEKQISQQSAAQTTNNTGFLSANLSANSLGKSRASILQSPSFALTAGSTIPCILETAIDSNLPGFVRCRVLRDIYSQNGKVVLLDEGTKVVGEYQGNIQQGQSRLFIVWTRAETPQGVLIDLGSPSTDFLGRSGIDGEVDTQFWTRFGNAIMLTLVDTGGNIAESKLQDFFNSSKKSESTVNINTGGENSPLTNIATNTIARNLNIPVIIRKRQGDLINIFLAKDLDFSSVYELKRR